MDFKRYAKSQQDAAPENGDDVKKTFDDTVRRAKNKSQSELMDDILKQAAADKASGKLSDKDMQNFVKAVSPMLDREQKKKLDEIMNLLNDIR